MEGLFDHWFDDCYYTDEQILKYKETREIYDKRTKYISRDSLEKVIREFLYTYDNNGEKITTTIYPKLNIDNCVNEFMKLVYKAIIEEVKKEPIGQEIEKIKLF